MTTRRDLLRLTTAGLLGVSFSRTSQPVLGQGTPAATPAAIGQDLLISADEAVAARAETQWLAVMDEAAYEAGHVEGDVRIGWDEMTLSDTSEEAVAEWTLAMRRLFAMRGVSPEEPVVVYDEGSLFAARGWWQLVYLGYPIPKVLDGGLEAWRNAGGEVVTGPSGEESAGAFPIDPDGIRGDVLATKDEVLQSLESPEVLIVDVRSADEYNAGHIPGAVNMPYTENAVMADANVYLAPEELRARYEALGMTDGMRAITYCTTGARGSVGAFAMRLAGFSDVALYAGSWDEWSADPAAPVE